MVMSQREVNRARIADVVRWFVEDCVVVTGDDEDRVAMREVTSAVSIYVVLEARDRPERIDRYDEATGRWRPFGTDTLLREVIVEQMVQAGATAVHGGRAFGGVRLQ
jgi:hypothetical protein